MHQLYCLCGIEAQANQANEETMKARVTEDGVVIPKRFLKGVKEVEIRREGNVVVVFPKRKADSIFKLGSNPVPCNTPDASENLDKYIY